MVVENLIPLVHKSELAGQISRPLGDAIGSTLAEVWNGIIGDRVVAWRL